MSLPVALPPNLMPGGLVFQTYRGDGSLWFEHRIARKDRPVELEYPDDPLAPGELVTLLVFDGDTGEFIFRLRAKGPDERCADCGQTRAIHETAGDWSDHAFVEL